MKIVVNRGRTVRIVVMPSVRCADGTWSRVVTKVCFPGELLSVPDDEAKALIARGFATEYEQSRPTLAK